MDKAYSKEPQSDEKNWFGSVCEAQDSVLKLFQTLIWAKLTHKGIFKLYSGSNLILKPFKALNLTCHAHKSIWKTKIGLAELTIIFEAQNLVLKIFLALIYVGDAHKGILKRQIGLEAPTIVFTSCFHIYLAQNMNEIIPKEPHNEGKLFGNGHSHLNSLSS